MTRPEGNKHILLGGVLPGLMAGAPYFSLEAVKSCLAKQEIAITSGTLRHYMSEAMVKGVVHDAGRGWYSGISEPFKLNTESVQKTIARIEKAFPLLDFSCWSTQQINPHMHHLLAKFVTFVHVDEDAVRSVGEWLQDEGFNAYVNPGKAEIEKSFAVREKTIVVRSGFVEETESGSHAAPIEFILADLLYETEKLPLMAKGEAKEAVERAVVSARISMGQLLMIAKRRRLAIDWLVSTH